MVLTLDVRGAAPAHVDRLRIVPGVASIGMAERDGAQTIDVQSDHARDLTPALLAALDDVTVVAVSKREPTLEDAYVSLIAGTRRERVAEAGCSGGDRQTRRPPPGPRARSLLVRAWRMDLDQLLRNRLFLLVAVLFPLVFVSVAFVMFRESTVAEPVALALTAGLMGMWSATLLGAGNTITRLRRWALLERLVASPTRRSRSRCRSRWPALRSGSTARGDPRVGGVVFDMPLHVEQPWLVASVPTTVLSLGLLGLLFASVFILYPTAHGLANLFEYPVWMLSGCSSPSPSWPGRSGTCRTCSPRRGGWRP